jgi:formamidopyrimidine-DNA glycosylase
MPELPDVEHLRRTWAGHTLGHRVRRTIVTDAGILRGGVSPEGLDRALRGRRFTEPGRVGKWLLARTDGPTSILHFGMDGGLEWGEDAAGRHRHDRVIFELEAGEVRFRNMRKLGGLWLAHDEAELERVLSAVGPDALGLGRRELAARLRTRRGQAKAVLMDQRTVSGVGNLLADEILWQAGLHPKAALGSLGDEEILQLADTVRSVLSEAVRRYDYLSRKRSWLNSVRGRPDASCPRCGTPLERTAAAGRTTWFCPRCQPAPGMRNGAPRRTRRSVG